MLICIIFYIFVIIALLLIYSKINIKYCLGWNNSYTCLIGKTAIVTGSNTGIGYWTALDFAKRGARIILACRNKEKAESAKDKIIEASGNTNVIVKLVDFTSLSSVRGFCKDFNETEEKLDILVNNAGAGGFYNVYTNDGLDITWQVNYLSAFLLTHLLIDKLKKSASSRIVNVSSSSAMFSDLKVEHINVQHKIEWKGHYFMYVRTKQSNIMFTTELARKLNGTAVNTYVLHPGFIETDIYRNMIRPIKIIFDVITKYIAKTPEEGAQTSIYCAVSKDLDNHSGRLYEDCKEIQIYQNCNNPDLARQLWSRSEELVKLREEEKIK